MVVMNIFTVISYKCNYNIWITVFTKIRMNVKSTKMWLSPCDIYKPCASVNRGFARRGKHLRAHDFSKSLGFFLHSAIWRKTSKNARTFDLLHDRI